MVYKIMKFPSHKLGFRYEQRYQNSFNNLKASFTPNVWLQHTHIRQWTIAWCERCLILKLSELRTKNGKNN